jgi:methylmalonyl-CoA epimerase
VYTEPKGVERLIEDIDHIGIAVADIDKTRDMYERVLNLKNLWTERLEEQGVDVAAYKVGDTKIELVQPISEDSPVGRFLQKRGEGLHHIALRVENIDKTLDDLRKKGVVLIDQDARLGAHGARIAFIHPKETNGVLYELVERDG